MERNSFALKFEIAHFSHCKYTYLYQLDKLFAKNIQITQRQQKQCLVFVTKNFLLKRKGSIGLHYSSLPTYSISSYLTFLLFTYQSAFYFLHIFGSRELCAWFSACTRLSSHYWSISGNKAEVDFSFKTELMCVLSR